MTIYLNWQKRNILIILLFGNEELEKQKSRVEECLKNVKSFNKEDAEKIAESCLQDINYLKTGDRKDSSTRLRQFISYEEGKAELYEI